MCRVFLNLFIMIGIGVLAVGPAHADGEDLFGTALGAGVGGLVGNSITRGSALGTSVGIVTGGLIGHELSRPSDAYGYSYSRPVYGYYAEPGYVYSAPPNMFGGYGGPVYQPNYVAPPSPPPPPPLPPTPVTYIDSDSGSYCREYSQTIRIGGQIHESYGTACLQSDGSWHIVK